MRVVLPAEGMRLARSGNRAKINSENEVGWFGNEPRKAWE